MFFASTHSRAFCYSVASGKRPQNIPGHSAQPSPWPSTSIWDQEAEAAGCSWGSFLRLERLTFSFPLHSPFPHGGTHGMTNGPTAPSCSESLHA